MPFDFQAAYEDLNPSDHDYRFYAGLARSRAVRRVVTSAAARECWR